MVFSSFVFLLGFLPIVLALYYICPKKLRNLVLLLASLLFYAWGEPIYVLIMIFSTVFDYTNGRLIGRMKEKGQLNKAKAVLIIDMCGNLGILGFFKYGDFVLSNINSITGAGIHLMNLALPIGISFYTFQTMSYTIDVYRGVVPPQKNFLNFATYVTLFPQLIAGPIVQYKTIGEELSSRTVTLSDFADGAFLFTVGLAKKVLIANQVGKMWNDVLGLQDMSVASAWLGAIGFSMQIYFDFSGYSDMAIGLGRMFGFHFLENFDKPYVSKSITEFWRRWHISLGSWFREYVYIPLGGNRKGFPRQILNLLIVWFLTGLWHGASWNFVLWGLYFGVILIMEKLFLLKLLKKLPKAIQAIYSLFLIVLGWMLFAQTDLNLVVSYIQHMFGVGATLVNTDTIFLIRNYAGILLVAIICCMDWKPIIEYRAEITSFKESTLDIWKSVAMVILLILSFCFLVGDSYNPFLYFRF